jgi:hypothetical protein
MRKVIAIIWLAGLLVGCERREGWPWPFGPPEKLSRSEVETDLRVLQRALETRYSYLQLERVDHRAALDQLLAAAEGGMARGVFARELMKLLARFGDGHARLRGGSRFLTAGYAPFHAGDTGEKLVAFHPDRRDFLDPARPYLTGMDGLPIAQWLAAAGRLRGGSPQAVRAGSVDALFFVNHLRGELGLPASSTVKLALASETGDRVIRELPVDGRFPVTRPPSRLSHRLLPGNVGHLRIREMDADPDFLSALELAMRELRNSRALIIDVRGNGGGSRAALRTLFPFFMAPGDAPRIVNVAAYRLGPGEAADAPAGYLSNRFLYPASSSAWTPVERRAIESFADGFVPRWSLPAGAFSAWHYFVLKPAAGPAVYHYDRPVAVLIDARCFSATDIFVGAFKGWRGVTIVGQTTGGGSGRARGFTLPESRIDLQLSSMASFQANGALYDGQGVAPDIEVPAIAATDFLHRTDTVLDVALQHLAGQTPRPPPSDPASAASGSH